MIKVALDKCLKVISNRFELVMLASTRAAKILSGAPAKYEAEKGKPHLVALKEIELGLTTKEELYEQVVERFRDEYSSLNLRKFIAPDKSKSRSKEMELEQLFSKKAVVADEIKTGTSVEAAPE